MPDIPGLRYVADHVDKAREQALIALVDRQPWLTELRRRVQHYGYRYDYKGRKVGPEMYLGPLPDWLLPLCQQLKDAGLTPRVADQVIVNEYEPGQGIAPHVDCVPCFGEAERNGKRGWEEDAGGAGLGGLASGGAAADIRRIRTAARPSPGELRLPTEAIVGQYDMLEKVAAECYHRPGAKDRPAQDVQRQPARRPFRGRKRHLDGVGLVEAYPLAPQHAEADAPLGLQPQRAGHVGVQHGVAGAGVEVGA